MSSFNYFSPQSNPSTVFSFPIPISSNKCTSTLNPDASTYIPSNTFTNKPSESPSLNAGAAPYIPLPPKLNNIQKHKRKKTPCPSFTYYSNLNSSQIYNATYKYIEMNNNKYIHNEDNKDNEDDIISTISSSIMDTPIPASVTSSVFSANNIDLMNIEPYIPNVNRTDIDQINNIIHINNDCDNDIHPVIAALTEKESNELLNAPIWTPEKHNNNMEEKDVIYSKIAIDEQDYQYIIHPNKKPIKYSYKQANVCRIAKESYNTPHIQYMNMNMEKVNNIAIADDNYKQPATSTIAGETYNENDEIININKKDRISECNDRQTINRNDYISKLTYNCHSKLTDNTISTHTNTNDLYSNKPSNIAMEGYCHLENNKSNILPYKIAYDTYTQIYNKSQIYNQSRIAQPYIEKISYVYCKT